MISVDFVLRMHDHVIDQWGGASGVREMSSLLSALNRPWQTFDGIDLYKTPDEKAAAIMESVIINHPFFDGNKRTGYGLMRLMLAAYEIKINATEEEKYQLAVAVASGKIRFDEILHWLKNHKV